MNTDDPRHGTTAGHNAHRKDGERSCDACLEAQRIHDRERAIRTSKPCATCGKLCRRGSTICRSCHQKEFASHVSRARQIQRAKRAAADEVETYPEDEIRYDGGWVRRGLVMVPVVTEPRRATKPPTTPPAQVQDYRTCRSCNCNLIPNSKWRTMSKQERAESKANGTTRHYARSLCGPCYRRAGEDETLLDHELLRLPQSTLLEEVAHHVAGDPELSQFRRAEIAAQRLGMTAASVERALVRANRRAS